jgi:hypothetical protein
MIKDPTLEAQVQAVLNGLLSDGAIPFALNVGKITKAESNYTIHFYDSRIRTAKVQLIRGQSLSEAVRSTVLARVAKMSGPLPASLPTHS